MTTDDRWQHPPTFDVFPLTQEQMQERELTEITACYETVPVEGFPDVLSRTSFATIWLYRVQGVVMVQILQVQNLMIVLPLLYRESKSRVFKLRSPFHLPSNTTRVGKRYISGVMLCLGRLRGCNTGGMSCIQTQARLGAPSPAVWVSLMWHSSSKQQPAEEK